MELQDPPLETAEQAEVESTPPTTVDQELAAMTALVEALGSIDDEARQRVMHWANDRFFPIRHVT